MKGEELFNWVKKSKTYKKVLDHRRKCKKWGKEFCVKCFGGGLIKFIKNLDKEWENRYKK